jgi:hypothetical protein
MLDPPVFADNSTGFPLSFTGNQNGFISNTAKNVKGIVILFLTAGFIVQVTETGTRFDVIGFPVDSTVTDTGIERYTAGAGEYLWIPLRRNPVRGA